MNAPDQQAQRLGYAGLLPPVLFLIAAMVDPSLRWIMLAAGFGYAAFIFSFLGGIWWGMAMGLRRVPLSIWNAAVAPSLISLALFMPWTFGWEWPVPSMRILATMILLSPLVDLTIAYAIPAPVGWMRLRIRLSLALSVLTMALSFL
ncbi:hypothetical protein BH10PSE13_BH10PSE13_08420 [soil metagenome]